LNASDVQSVGTLASIDPIASVVRRDANPAATPEPTNLVVLGTGALLLGVRRRRQS
jgi:hypothetical protein